MRSNINQENSQGRIKWNQGIAFTKSVRYGKRLRTIRLFLKKRKSQPTRILSANILSS